MSDTALALGACVLGFPAQARLMDSLDLLHSIISVIWQSWHKENYNAICP